MTGAAVAAGDKGWAQQQDVAPTIAALLGIDPPRTNEGRTIPKAISMPATDAAAKALALANQRRQLAEAYRVSRGLVAIETADCQRRRRDRPQLSASPTAPSGLGSYDGVEDLTEPVLRFARRDMETARQEWLARERTLRLLCDRRAADRATRPRVALSLRRQRHRLLRRRHHLRGRVHPLLS